MATTIINPQPAKEAPEPRNNGLGFLLGVIVLIVFAFLVFVYVIPIFQQGLQSRVQLNVPDEVNVKVQQGQ